MIYRFDGPDYVHDRDAPRLTEQLGRVFAAIRDCKWHTLEDLALRTEDPPASISAQLRHLRKPRFGQWLIEKEYRGDGLYVYRLAGRFIPDGKQLEIAI
jgi:hypothetical protein